MHNVSYNNRVDGQKLRLDINFWNRLSRSSLGSWKPKHLQQSFITAILDVLNNFIGILWTIGFAFTSISSQSCERGLLIHLQRLSDPSQNWITYNLLIHSYERQPDRQVAGGTATNDYFSTRVLVNTGSCQWRRRGDGSAYLGPKGSEPWTSVILKLVFY